MVVLVLKGHFGLMAIWIHMERVRRASNIPWLHSKFSHNFNLLSEMKKISILTQDRDFLVNHMKIRRKKNKK